MCYIGLVRSDSRRSMWSASGGTSSIGVPSGPKKQRLKTPQSAISSITKNNSSVTRHNASFFADTVPGCFFAIVEGRGSARGEIGLASISLSSPTLILCQFSDTRTYSRTLTKLAVLNPSDILVR